MADVLGQALVEILADATPFATGFSDAVEEAGQQASAELTSALEEASGEVGDTLTAAGVEGGEGFTDGVTGAVDDLDIDPGGAFDGFSDEAESAAADVGAAFAGVDVDIDVDAGGAFDGLAGEAEDAADAVVDAFSGIGGAVADEMSEVEGAFDGVSGSLGSLQGALGTAAGGAGLEAFARGQAPMREQSQRVAASLGVQNDVVRDLAVSLSNVTFPQEEVLALMETARQRGLEGADALGEYATFWDMVGDATGESGTALGAAGVALAAVGIEVGNEAEALEALGFVTENTTGSVGDFLQFLERAGPELREMGADVNDAAAIVGVLETEFGLTARTARQEFRSAVNEADGDMSVMLETLGISEEQFAAYRGEVEASSDIIERNADIHADSFTPIQRLQSGLERLAFRFSGVADVASLVAAPLGAIGPLMLGLNQGSQLLASGMGTRLVAGLRGAATGFRTLSVAILTNPIFLIAAVIIGIIAVVWMFRDEIMDALGGAWDWIKDTLGNLLDWWKDTWETITDFVPEVLGNVIEWLRDLPGRIIGALGGLATSVLTFIAKWHPAAVLWRALTGGGDESGSGVIGWLRELPGRIVDALAGFASTVFDFIVKWHPVAILWRALTGGGDESGSGVVGWLRELPGRIVDALAGFASTVFDFIAEWHPAAILWRAVTGGMDDVMTVVGELVDGVVEWVLGLRDRALGFVEDLVTGAVQAFVDWRDDAIAAAQALWDGVVERVDELVGWVQGLPGRILDAIGNLGSLLWESGRDLIGGLMDGITDRIPDLTEVATNAAETFSDLWPFSPAKEGPLRDRPMDEAGKNLIASIVAGIRTALPQLRDIAIEAADTAAGAVTQPLDVNMQGRRRASTEVTNITVNQRPGETGPDSVTRALRRRSYLASAGGT